LLSLKTASIYWQDDNLSKTLESQCGTPPFLRHHFGTFARLPIALFSAKYLPIPSLFLRYHFSLQYFRTTIHSERPTCFRVRSLYRLYFASGLHFSLL